MENLNAEQVKKGLECFHQRILDTYLADDIREGEMMAILDALDLINSQEQRIGELTEKLTRKETEYNELYELLQTYKADSEAYRSYSKTLEKENEGLKTLLDESYDAQNSLTEENERLSKEFVEYIKTAPIVKIDEGVISEFAIKRAIRNYELHFGKSAKLDQIAKEMLEGEE